MDYLRAGLIFACLAIVGILWYQSMVLDKTIPEYMITFFASTATLLIGLEEGGKKESKEGRKNGR